MKSLLPLFLIAASVASAPGAIVITEVMSSSGHGGGTNNGDWFEIINTGASAVDITGWTWNDNDSTNSPGNFGSLTSIGAGQSVIIAEEDASGFISAWGLSGVTVVGLGGTIFQGLSGPNGDSVIIYDNLGAVVASVTFGAAVQGSSFEWDSNGTSLATSIAGQNGAFVASANGQTTGPGPGTDIGSPGIAVVPEPSSLLLSGLGALALLTRRRSR
jgi:hypothetical protein